MDPIPSNPVPRPRLSPEDADALRVQREEFASADSLLRLPAFQWFLRECVAQRITAAQEAALDTGKPLEERNVAAHVRKALAEVLAWTEERRDSTRETIAAVQA